MRNGMQAHIVPVGEGHQLVVQGHDFRFHDTPSASSFQLLPTGVRTMPTKAYNTFTEIVKDDFDLPRNSSMPVMPTGGCGLHHPRSLGNTAGSADMGCRLHSWMDTLTAGRPPPTAAGQRWNALGGRTSRRTCRELQSGGYGFYYKGHPQQPNCPPRRVAGAASRHHPMVGSPEAKNLQSPTRS